MLNRLKVLLFTSCLLATMMSVNAAQNQIISTGVRKISDNTVNFTFYTSGDSLEKPIVKSKGDNEYTILLPNMSDNTSRSINISETGGIVTSADVKTINEGAVTYTKVNLKTSKPVIINAETKKTSQTVSDSSSISNIVSKVNLINQDIQNTKNISADNSSYTSSSQPAVRVSSVKDIIRQNSAAAPKKNAIQEAVAVNSVSAHTPSVKKIDKSANNKSNSENIKNSVKTSENKAKSVNNNTKPVAKPISAAENTKITKSPKDIDDLASANIADTDEIMPPEDVSLPKLDEEENVSQVPTYSDSFSLGDSIKNILFSPFTTIVLLTCLLVAFFGFLFKKLTANLSATKSINDSFIEKLNGVLNKPKSKDFSQIVNNENMNWQEKYKAFNETNNEADNVETKNVNSDYVFDLTNEQANEQINANDVADTEEDLNIDDLANQEEEMVSEVMDSSEKDENHKFSGFANNVTKPVSSAKPVQSHKLKSFDNAPVQKQSLKEKLDKIVEDDNQSRSQVRSLVTNTIAKKSSADNMRIVQNSAIDRDKEFYIVNENGEYSLLGRVKNRLVILKRFGKNAPSDLQVHRSQGNAFVVKAGDFRTQVDVTDTDMNIYSQV